MTMQPVSPGLFGQKHSSRDYTKARNWGKNIFNSSFPASLVAYMHSKGVCPVYLCVDRNNSLRHDYISGEQLFGINPLSDNAYYNFEAGFSTFERYYTGKRDEDNGRGSLTVCYAQITAAIRPELFVMENVPRIVKTQKLAQAREIFKSAGYGLTATVLDASLCGVPQARKRFVMVGKLGAANNFLLPIINKNLASKPLTVSEYLGDTLPIKYYYRHPRSYVRRGIFSVNEPSPTIRGVNRPMPKGYHIHAGDPVNSLEGIRALTTKERSRIQTFPASFIFLGNKTDQEQMIGNAVPVNLARFVGQVISEYISIKHKPTPIQYLKMGWSGATREQSFFEPSASYKSNMAHSDKKRAE